MAKVDGFTCGCCGEFHEGLARCLPTSSPTAYVLVPAKQRKARCRLNEDFCVIDDQHYFIYGSLELPIHGRPDPFIWGVWAAIDEKDFHRAQDLIGVKGRESERPYVGRLATDIPFYPPCLDLALNVQTQPAGLRPLMVLRRAKHPLVREQSNGISPARVQEIMEWFLHGRFEQSRRRTRPGT
jgi:hypothetical protein